MFQSTPPAEARGDADGLCVGRRIVVVSIHSPRRSEGRPALAIRPEGYENVSIHSPRRSEGRPWSAVGKVIPESFQSTPPAEARGDGGLERFCREPIVSIHSPR